MSFKADVQLRGRTTRGGLSYALSSISRVPEMYAYVCVGAIVMDNTARNSISLIKRIRFPSPAIPQDSRRLLHGEAHTSSQIQRNDKSRVNLPSRCLGKRNQSYSETDTCSMRRKILEIIAINLIASVEKKPLRGIKLFGAAILYIRTLLIMRTAVSNNQTDWKCYVQDIAILISNLFVLSEKLIAKIWRQSSYIIFL